MDSDGTRAQLDQRIRRLLKTMRRSAGVAQVQMARVLGISQKGISAREVLDPDATNRTDISLLEALLWAGHCGYTIRVTEGDGRLLDEIGKLDPENRSVLLGLARAISTMDPTHREILAAIARRADEARAAG